MNRCQQSLLAAMLTAASFPAFAEAINYSFVSVKYSSLSSLLNGFHADIKGNLITLDLSLALRPHVALVAAFSSGKADVRSAGISYDGDIDSLSFGLVIHAPINDYSDFLLGVSFVNGDVDVDDSSSSFEQSEDINGGQTSIGIRSRISHHLEFAGALHRNSIVDDSSISLSLSLGYFATESMSIDLGFAADTDGDTVMLGITQRF